MKEPRRLFESSDSEVERLLLRAGRERAPRGAKRRAIAAATGVVAASTLAAGKVAGATNATIAGKAAAGVKAASVLSLKWIVIASVASVSVVAGTVAVQSVRAERAEAAAAMRASSAPARPRATPVSAPVRVASPPVVAAPVEDALPVAPVVPSAIAPGVIAPSPPIASAVAVRASAPPVASSGSSAVAELTFLDQARTATNQGNPAHALALLDIYASRFPHPMMGPEASLLRIEALVKSGDRAAAERARDAFLRANPSSPYAPRIESLLGSPNP